MTRRRLAAIAFGVSLLPPGPTHAATLRPMDLSELALEASVILHGRVVEVRPEWVRGGRQIDSVVTVEVETLFKGEPARRFSFLAPGGQIGVYRTVVPGAPELAYGAEVVLFLAPHGAERAPSVVGLSQGVLKVLEDASGKKRVRAPFLVPGLAEAHLPARIALTLEELAGQLATIHAAARVRGRR